MTALEILGGSLLGVVGLILTATGYFAFVGLPLAVVAILLLTSGAAKPARPVEARQPAPPAPKPVLSLVVRQPLSPTTTTATKIAA